MRGHLLLQPFDLLRKFVEIVLKTLHRWAQDARKIVARILDQLGYVIRQSSHVAQTIKLAVQRDVEQSLFHGHVRQSEPLLRVVNAQNDLRAEQRAASFLARRMRLDQREQLGPLHHTIHLVKELVFAGLAAGQIQPELG